MPAIDKQIKLIERMAKREELVSQLYKGYAEKFTDRNEFWTRLANDEIDHAGLIRTISAGMVDGSLYFKEDRFEQEKIEYAMDYIQDMVSGGLSEGTTLIDALAIALEIENCFIEKGSFESFANDPDRLKKVFESLTAANKKHRDKIEALLNSLKK